MKITIDFDGIQENKNYIFQFSLSSDGQVVVNSAVPVSKTIPKKNTVPSLEDFENKEKSPQIEELTPRIKKDFKVTSSFDGKLDEGKNV